MSSKRALRRRSCEGKTRYPSVEVARAAAKSVKRRGHIVTPYRCPFCGGIHLGHPSHDGKP